MVFIRFISRVNQQVEITIHREQFSPKFISQFKIPMKLIINDNYVSWLFQTFFYMYNYKNTN